MAERAHGAMGRGTVECRCAQTRVPSKCRHQAEAAKAKGDEHATRDAAPEAVNEEKDRVRLPRLHAQRRALRHGAERRGAHRDNDRPHGGLMTRGALCSTRRVATCTARCSA